MQTIGQWLYCDLHCCAQACSQTKRCKSFVHRQRDIQSICYLKDRCVKNPTEERLDKSHYTSYITPCDLNGSNFQTSFLSFARNVQMDSHQPIDREKSVLLSRALSFVASNAFESLENTLCQQLSEPGKSLHNINMVCNGLFQCFCDSFFLQALFARVVHPLFA